MTTKNTKLTDGAPDYSYWCKMGYWTVEQAVTLLLELDPRDVLQDMQLAPEVSSDIKRRYSDLHRLLVSHIGRGGLLVVVVTQRICRQQNILNGPSIMGSKFLAH